MREMRHPSLWLAAQGSEELLNSNEPPNLPQVEQDSKVARVPSSWPVTTQRPQRPFLPAHEEQMVAAEAGQTCGGEGEREEVASGTGGQSSSQGGGSAYSSSRHMGKLTKVKTLNSIIMEKHRKTA